MSHDAQIVPAAVESQESDVEDHGLGLDDLLPEPESPLPAPYSFASYRLPDSLRHAVGGTSSDQLLLRLVGSHPLWGHHLWNTARVLSDYLAEHAELYRGKTVLELGAGAGLPSLVCALNGAQKTVITDYPDHKLVGNIRYNAEMNIPKEVDVQVAVDGFVWGHPSRPLLEHLPRSAEGNPLGEGYDLLLLSDLVFNHSQHPALVSSVNSLLSRGPSASILVFFTHHRPHLVKEDMAFFPLLQASGDGWAYKKVVEVEAGVMFEEDKGDAKVRATVHGYRAWRERSSTPRATAFENNQPNVANA